MKQKNVKKREKSENKGKFVVVDKNKEADYTSEWGEDELFCAIDRKRTK